MASSVLGLIGGGISAFGQIKQGQQAKAAGEYNFQLQQENAALATQEGDFAIARQKREAEQAIGQATAQYGASGVDTGQGSALDVLQQSAAQGVLDSSKIAYQASLKARGFRQTGDIDLFKGQNAETSSYYSAAGTLLGSSGSALSSAGGGSSSIGGTG